jgi:hypothetical protein
LIDPNAGIFRLKRRKYGRDDPIHENGRACQSKRTGLTALEPDNKVTRGISGLPYGPSILHQLLAKLGWLQRAFAGLKQGNADPLFKLGNRPGQAWLRLAKGHSAL